MSHLPPQAITEFQALYEKHVGCALPPEHAATRANEVFAVLRLLLEPPLEPPQQPTKQVSKSPERNDMEPSSQHPQ